MAAVEYLVTDFGGTVYGRFATETLALVEREFLIADGVDCWVLPVTDLFIEDWPC